MNTPLPFSQFYDSVTAWAEKKKEQRISAALKKTMAGTERLAELSEKVNRGTGARKFLESDFWKDHMNPYLRSEAVLKPAGPKDGYMQFPGLFIEYLVGSGRVRVLSKLMATLDDWQEQGEEAEKVLLLEAGKRQRMRE